MWPSMTSEEDNNVRIDINFHENLFISECARNEKIWYKKFHLCTFEWNGCVFCATINEYIGR